MKNFTRKLNIIYFEYELIRVYYIDSQLGNRIKFVQRQFGNESRTSQLKISCSSISTFVQERDATRHETFVLLIVFSHCSELRATAAYVIVEVYKYLFIDIYIQRVYYIFYSLYILFFLEDNIWFSSRRRIQNRKHKMDFTVF